MFDGQLDDAARAVVGLVSARYHGLDGAHHELLTDWCDPSDLGRQDALLVTLRTLIRLLHTELCLLRGLVPEPASLLVPPRHGDGVAEAARQWTFEGGEPPPAPEVADPVAFADRLVDDLLALLILSAVVTGRDVAEQLAKMGLSASTGGPQDR